MRWRDAACGSASIPLRSGRAGTQVTVYDDEDGARKEEIAALRGDNVFG